MIRYTTPTIELIVEGIDLTPYEVYVTFRQENRAIVTFDVTEMEYDGQDTTISVTFSQKQSASFQINKNAEVQVNWLVGGSRNATEIATINIQKQLLEKVIDS